MPRKTDDLFAQKALEEGLLEEMRKEQAFRILANLERAGNPAPIWEILVERGWMKEDDVQYLFKEHGEELDEHEGEYEIAPQPPDETDEQEFITETPIARSVGKYYIAVIHHHDAPEFIEMMHRPMNVGSDSRCDIVVEDCGLENRHARLTLTDRGPSVWDVGAASGVIVNGSRRTMTDLKPGDLIKMGDALFLLLQEPVEHEGAIEPISPRHVGGDPVGAFYITSGQREGAAFYFSEDKPVVLGKNRLADIRLDDRQVAHLHTQVAVTSAGVKVTDLLSSFKTTVNGKPVGQHVIKNGDQIGVGEVVLRFEQLREPKRKRGGTQQEEASGESRLEIPLDAELEKLDIDEGGIPEPPSEQAARPQARAFEPDKVALNAIDGPLEGQIIPIRKNNTMIGRGKGVDLVISDLSVSRRHALLSISPEGALEVVDQGSRNGVLVNGKRLPKARLNIGDTVVLGSSVFVVEEYEENR